jgi:hypothetical protein
LRDAATMAAVDRSADAALVPSRSAKFAAGLRAAATMVAPFRINL